jgi:hypothetical protein
MELVSRFTEQDVTPSTAETAFSTRALHAAQLMPVTSYCCIKFSLFNQSLQNFHQLVHGIDPLRFDIVRHAGAYMLGKQFPVKGIERGRNRGYLNKYIHAVSALLDHAFYSPHLSLYTAQPVKKRAKLLAASFFSTTGARDAFRYRFHIFSHNLSSPCDTPAGYLHYIPLQGMCQVNFMNNLIFPFKTEKYIRRSIRRRRFTQRLTAAA